MNTKTKKISDYLAISTLITLAFMLTLPIGKAWLGDYQYRQQWTLTNETDSSTLSNQIPRVCEKRLGFTGCYDGINVTVKLTGTNASKEIAVTDLSDNEIYDFDVECFNTNQCEIIFPINVTSNNNISGYVYYDLTSMTESAKLKQIRYANDEFNGTTGTCSWLSTGLIYCYYNGDGTSKVNVTSGTNAQWGSLNMSSNRYVYKTIDFRISISTSAVTKVGFMYSADQVGTNTNSEIYQFWNNGITYHTSDRLGTSTQTNIHNYLNNNYQTWSFKWNSTNVSWYLNNGYSEQHKTNINNFTSPLVVSIRRDTYSYPMTIDYVRVYSNQTDLGYEINFNNKTYSASLEEEESKPTIHINVSLELNSTSDNYYYLNNTYANVTATANVSNVVLNITSNYTGYESQYGIGYSIYPLMTATANNTYYNFTSFCQSNSSYTCDNSATYYAIVYITSTPIPTTTLGTLTEIDYAQLDWLDRNMGGLAQASGNTYCIDNNTQSVNVSYYVQVGNESQIIIAVLNKTCQYGCDSVMRECNPSPLEQWFYIFLAIIGIFVLLVIIRWIVNRI